MPIFIDAYSSALGVECKENRKRHDGGYTASREEIGIYVLTKKKFG
jgi:hypothetical protein